MDCAPYLTLYSSAVKDWKEVFGARCSSTAFGLIGRDDFRVVQSSVQAEPRTAASSDPASPSNAEFTSLQSGARQPAAFVAAFWERRPFLPTTSMQCVPRQSHKCGPTKPGGHRPPLPHTALQVFASCAQQHAFDCRVRAALPVRL